MPETPLLLTSHLPSASAIKDIAVAETDTGPQVVCADARGAVWTWDPSRDAWKRRQLTYAFTGDPLAARYPDAENEIDKVAAAVVDGRVVLAAGGDEQAPALWNLETGGLLRGTTYDAPYLGAIATVRGEGPPRFVTGSQYVGRLLLWEPSGRTPPVEVPNDLYDITSLAAAWVDGRSLVASGGDQVDVWDLARDEQVASFDSYDGDVLAVSFARLGDRPVVVAAADSREVYVWDLSDDGDGEPVHDPIDGHEGPVLALDTAAVGARGIVVTGSEDRTVRLWDLTEGTAIGAPLTGHQAAVEALVTTTLRGRDVVVSADGGGAVHVWDLAAAVSAGGSR